MNHLAGSFFAAISPVWTKFRSHPATESKTRLNYETLENRYLLAGDLLPTIVGQSFIDLTDDGISSDDIPLSEAGVRLYADNGDGSFSSADQLLQSATTDTQGGYRFENVAPGLYFVEQVADSRVTRSADQEVQRIVVTEADTDGAFGFAIDDFDTGEKSAFASSNGPMSSDVVETISSALGGQRDMFVSLTDGLGALELSANPYGSQLLQYDSTAGVQGDRIVSWDGIDATAAGLNPTGLPHIDLTENGDNSAFVLTIGSDQDDGAVTVRVHTDGGRASEATIFVPNSGGPATLEVLVPFDEFTPVAGKSAADFTDVGAVELAVVGKNSVDGQIALFSVMGPLQIRQDLVSLPLTDLQLTKNDNPDPVAAGGELVYTLFATNNGPWDATGVTVMDALPPSVVFESATISRGSVVHEDGTVTADIGDLAVDETVEITLTVTVGAGVDGTILNTAMITGNEHDPVPENNKPEEPTLVVPQIDLTIDKSDNPDPVIAGEDLTYTLIVTNNGPSDATGVTVVDTLPPQVSFRNVDSSQGSALADGQQVRANLGDVASGASATIEIAVGVSAAARGTLLNVVEVTGNETETNPDNNRDEEPTQINPLIDLSIEKSDNPDPVVGGQELTYDLTVTNHGPSDATGVIVTDNLPTGVSLLTSNSSQGSVSANGDELTVDLGDLAVGASATVTLIVEVDPSTRGTILNTARVSANEEEITLENNVDQEPTEIAPQVDLAIIKLDEPDPASAGGSLVWLIEVVNNGLSDATGVTVVDTLPSGVTFRSATSSQGTTLASGNQVTANLQNLAVGETATIEVLVDIDASTRGTLLNTATITSNEQDINLANNLCEEETHVDPVIDLQIIKSDAPDPVQAGETLAYTLVVTNNGPSDATGVIVTDDLPAGLNFQSVTSSQGSAGAAGSIVTATLGNLAAGQTATIDILASVSPTARGTLVNTARVSGNESETILANNEDEEDTQINPLIDLSIVKTDSSDLVHSGDALTYTLTITNHGPAAATGVVVRDSLSGEVDFRSVTASQGSASHDEGRISADLGDLAVGASATVIIETSVLQSAMGTIENRAEVEAQEQETNLANNFDVETTNVEMLMSSISGTVFLDRDDDGLQDSNDPPLSGVTVRLTGQNVLEENIELVEVTDSNGDYLFAGLKAGLYTLEEEQPPQYRDGKDTLGPLARAQLGDFGTLTVLDDLFSGIALPAGVDATDNDFAELAATSFSKRRFIIYGN